MLRLTTIPVNISVSAFLEPQRPARGGPSIMAQTDTLMGKGGKGGPGLVTLFYFGLEARRAGAPKCSLGGNCKTVDEHMEQNL